MSVLGTATWKKRRPRDEDLALPQKTPPAASPEQIRQVQAMPAAGEAVSSTRYRPKPEPAPQAAANADDHQGAEPQPPTEHHFQAPQEPEPEYYEPEPAPPSPRQSIPKIVQEPPPGETAPIGYGSSPTMPPLPTATAQSYFAPREPLSPEMYRAAASPRNQPWVPAQSADPPETIEELLNSLGAHQRQRRLDVEQAFRQGGGARTGLMNKHRFMAQVDLIFRRLGLRTGQLVALADRFGAGMNDPRFGGFTEVKWRDFAREVELRS